MTRLDVSRADLLFEAGFPKPEFSLFRDTAALLDRLYRRLEPYGVKLTDIRLERGAGTIADQHLLLYLFNYLMTVRVRADRIEVTCSDLPRDSVERFSAAILDILTAAKDYRPELSFRAFALAVGFHARPEGQSAREYLTRFATNVPKNIGPPTGNGAVFYFGVEGDRLFSTITADMSAVVSDGLFVRVNAAWDAGRVPAEALPGIADTFVRQALESLGLQLPA